MGGRFGYLLILKKLNGHTKSETSDYVIDHEHIKLLEIAFIAIIRE